jgi:hypothetical protein
MSDEECMEFIFPKDRTGRTEVTSLPKMSGRMPNIIVGDEFVGLAPLVGPTPEILDQLKKNEQPK